MKTKNMVEAITEYNRLKGLAESIEKYIEDLSVPISSEAGASSGIVLTTVQFTGDWTVVDGGGPTPRREYKNVTLSADVTNHLRDDLVAFLRAKAKELRARMEAMEV